MCMCKCVCVCVCVLCVRKFACACVCMFIYVLHILLFEMKQQCFVIQYPFHGGKTSHFCFVQFVKIR